jgi:hypothetical protein
VTGLDWSAPDAGALLPLLAVLLLLALAVTEDVR